MNKFFGIASLTLVGALLVGCGVVTTDQSVSTDQELTRADFSAEEKMNIHMCLMGGGQDCDEIFDPTNQATYADAILEQCEYMSGMEQCDEYFGVQEEDGDSAFRSIPRADALPAGTSQVVELQDGDSYTISIDEVTKTINGQTLRMMAYNGTIPGPLLKAPQGSTITLTVINNIDDIETTVHHHGLRLDEAYDGVPVDMGGFDVPISQGEILVYTLTFPDSGIFWYHPHVREELQQELGLYGNYLVTDPDVTIPTNTEHTIMLDDIFLQADGSIVPFDQEVGTHVVMGRFGNIPLINGDTNFRLTLDQGEVTRLYLTNVANVTPFNITTPGLRMKLVGGDIGAYEREEYIDNLVIAPAERYIIDIYASESGEYTITNQMKDGSYTMGTIVVSNDQVGTSYESVFNTLNSYDEVMSDIDQYRKYFDRPIDKTLSLDIQMDGMTGQMPMTQDDHASGTSADMIALPGGLTLDPHTIEWEDEMPIMNQISSTQNTHRDLVDVDTGEKNMDIQWTFDQGDVVKIRIYNDPDSVHPMQHPIHFHGQRFLLLNKNGQINQNLVWKDTVLVPTGEYVDILLDASNPGTRMVHCHIAEHLTAGMMMSFEVRP